MRGPSSLFLFFVLFLFFGLGSSSLPTLSLVHEKKVSELVGASGRYEASGCCLRNTTQDLYVVLDNEPNILVVGNNISKATFVGGFGVKEDGFEGAAFDFQGSNEGDMEFFSMVESEKCSDNQYHGKLYMWSNSMIVEDKQELDAVTFETDNKGFEGLCLVRYPGGGKSHTGRYLFALCEGNSCKSGSMGSAGGEGRIKVFAEKDTNDWDYIDNVKLPSSLDFTDYSGLDIDGSNIAVVSQEDSKLWIGTLAVKDEDDFYINGEGTEYKFPRDSNGNKIYCNIEGVAFADQHSDFPKETPVEKSLYFVSDKAKSDQNDRCEQKDQSVHMFVLPQ